VVVLNLLVDKVSHDIAGRPSRSEVMVVDASDHLRTVEVLLIS
jgi:hypothetical protein